MAHTGTKYHLCTTREIIQLILQQTSTSKLPAVRTQLVISVNMPSVVWTSADISAVMQMVTVSILDAHEVGLLQNELYDLPGSA